MGTHTEAVKGGTKVNDILLRDFTSPFRRGYVRITPKLDNGVKRRPRGYLFPEYYCTFEKTIREFEVREDDFLVASYPKTGTTWTQEMVWCIGNDLDFERAKSIILPIRFPFLELSSLFETVDESNEELETTLQEFLKDSVKFTIKMESPRYIKTHFPWEFLPDQIKSKKTKIIYIARNPKDTCVSYFHHARLIEGYKGSFEDFVELFLEDAVAYSPYWDHILSYWAHREDSNVLFLKYEDLKKDLPSVINKVTSFMGKKPLCEDDLTKLCSHLSFESMKSNISVNYEYVIDQGRASKLPENDRHFIRKGKVNGWKEEMSPDLSRRIDEWTVRHLDGTNLSFS